MKMIEIKCNRKVVVRINEIIKVLSVALFIASSSPLHSLQMIQEKHRLASNNEARDRLSSGELNYRHELALGIQPHLIDYHF